MTKAKLSQPRIHKILSKFNKAKVLVIGDLMLDEFIWGSVSRISPEAPVPVVLIDKSSFMPGGASNVMNNIRSLGGQVYACGVIGQDQNGAILADELRQRAVNTDGIFVEPLKPTIKKTRIIAQHQQVVRVDKETHGLISPEVHSRISNFIEKVIKDVDAVIIEDYGKGLIQPKLIKHVIKLAKQNKKIIAVDPKEDHFSYYKGVDIVTPNLHEASSASHTKIKDKQSLEIAAGKIIKKLSCKALLITLGEQGMALFESGKRMVQIPTIAREVFDVSGAGDTVIALFTLAKSVGASMKEAAYISNVAAGIVVGKLGVAVVKPQELKRQLKKIIRGKRK